MEECAEVIDLTDSITYCRAPINLSCSIIDLDDSIDSVPVGRVQSASVAPAPVPCNAPATGPITIEGESDLPEVTLTKKSKPSKTKRQSRIERTSTPTNPERERSPHLGYCPICHDTFGTNPMASTKCGHVYCVTCIEQALKVEKKCPTCRISLKGAKPYHPLFL